MKRASHRVQGSDACAQNFLLPSSHMSETIFSRIIAGQIPCHRIYEDAHVLSFLDIAPLAPRTSAAATAARVIVLLAFIWNVSVVLELWFRAAS